MKELLQIYSRTSNLVAPWWKDACLTTSGHVAMGVFVVVGHTIHDFGGAATSFAIVVAFLASAVTALCHLEQGWTWERFAVAREHAKENVDVGARGQFPHRHDHDDDGGAGRRLNLLHEGSSSSMTWMQILAYLALVAANGRALSAAIDKTSGCRIHNFTISTLGVTPFVEAVPDFVGGLVVFVSAVFVAVGFEERSRALSKCLATTTAFGFSALLLITLGRLGAKGDVDGLDEGPRHQDHHPKGFALSIGMVLLVLSIAWEETQRLKTVSGMAFDGRSLAEGKSWTRRTILEWQSLISLALAVEAVLLVVAANFGPPSETIREMRILQLFKGTPSNGVDLCEAFLVVIVICSLCLTLLHLTIPLHQKMFLLIRRQVLPALVVTSEVPHLLPSLILGVLASALAVLVDLFDLLVLSATARASLEAVVCMQAVLARFGIISPRTSFLNSIMAWKKKIYVKRKKKWSTSRGHRQRLDDEDGENPDLDHRNASATSSASFEMQEEPHKSRSARQLRGRGNVDAADKPRPSNLTRSPGNVLARLRKVVERLLPNGYKQFSDSQAPMVLMGQAEHSSDAINEECRIEPPLTSASPSNSISHTSDDIEDESETSSDDSYSSSGISSDTDIDSFVEEYLSCGPVDIATISGEATSQCPCDSQKRQRTSSKASMAVCGLLLCFVCQHVVLTCLTTYPSLIISNLTLSLLEFPLLVYLQCLTQDDLGHTEDGDGECLFLRVPLFPWWAFLAVWIHVNVALALLTVAWPGVLVWTVTGLIIAYTGARSPSSKRRVKTKRRSLANSLIPANRPNSERISLSFDPAFRELEDSNQK